MASERQLAWKAFDLKLVDEVVCGTRRRGGAALATNVLRATHGLIALGVAPGDRVALLLRNDFAFIEATLASQHIGAYAVPLNWHGAPDEILFILNDCQARVLIAHADLAAALPPLAIPLVVVDTPDDVASAYRATATTGNAAAGASRWLDWLAAQSTEEIAAVPATESLIYTSGTSGRPKGVKRAAPTSLQAARTEAMRVRLCGFDDDTRAMVPAPIYHSASNMYAMRAARSARSLVLPPRFEARTLLTDIERHRITHLYAVATMFQRLLAIDADERARHDVSSLRFVLHAGGPCPPDIKHAMIRWLGPVVHEYYGSTEAGAITFCSASEWLEQPGTVGRAVDGVDIAVLDDAGMRLPAGEVGEICVANANYTDFSYIGAEDARAEMQRGSHVATGDVGLLDEQGYLFLRDRKKDLVISGGVNIYPAEIEAVLLSLPGVADCAVFGIPDAEFGEAVAALVQRTEGSAVSEDELRAALGARLARFKHPRLIEFRDSLPREASGKIRKRLLRDAYWAGTGRAI